MKKILTMSVLLALPLCVSPVSAQISAQNNGQNNGQNSAPTPSPIVDTIPASQDRSPPGPMTLLVDATDIKRAIFRVKQNIPIEAAGTNYLLYPKWLPGKHAPRGAIDALSGLKISANGKPIEWTRDPIDVFAFKVDVPQGVKSLDVEFQFLSPIQSREGRIVITPEMMNVQWEQVALYPAGYYTRNIGVKPSIILPQGWTGIAALDGGVTRANRIDYAQTSIETLIDSPMFAGAHFKKWDLGNNVTLNVFGDEAKLLEAKPEHIADHKALVDEAVILFGSKHFDRYEFLLALTDKLGGIGLEHHRSSENTRAKDYFTNYDKSATSRGLLPHEIIHSWNGKFRRPDGLWTPDYRTPMQDNLLWVYEGQTSYWDLVLGARSGLQSKEIVLGEWARHAAYYSIQAGREWRSVEDTTHDPITAARKPKPFSSWQRREDYYSEGSLIWMAVDMTLRSESNGAKTLDDFAKAFFGINDGDWGTVTYNFDTIVDTLNAVHPYDWATFLDKRFRKAGQPAPVEGIELGGYKLVWKDEPSAYEKEIMTNNKGLSLAYSLGISLAADGSITDVLWDSPAFKQSIVGGSDIIAVDGKAYSHDLIQAAIKNAQATKKPFNILVKRGDLYTTHEMAYYDGLRFPHLEPKGEGEQPLDRLLKPRR